LTHSRTSIRQQLRRRRQALSAKQQQHAARQLDRQISSAGLFKRSQHIAFYLANDGEIDPQLLLARAHRQGRCCYLPVLAPGNRIYFVRYRPGDRLKINRFGIAEPTNKRPHKSWALNLALLPLVGFDLQGGRLGMGGGFYDRSFAWQLRHPQITQVRLVGLAHSCQQVDEIKQESWDIPLAAVATDEGVFCIQRDDR
jgi:5-formyltetrahydrofolate cyclo-ligase